ncbi:MAG: SpoIIE family protein phosphatase [Ignavibacteria bacterium]|nr:SpoIIE family protein phosphatase [Ignavibacteria bacterium]
MSAVHNRSITASGMTAPSKQSAESRTASETRFDLSALFEFSSVVNASLDLTFILGHFLLTVMGKLVSLRGIILLEHKKGAFRIENVKGLPEILIGTSILINKIPKRLTYIDTEDAQKLSWLTYFKDKGISVLIPLVAQEKIVGVAGFAPSILRKKLSEKEATYVKSLANIAAAAIEKSLIIAELSRVNRRLDGKIQELNTLFELSKEFNVILEPDRVVKLLMFSLMGQIGVSRFAICLEKEGVMNVVSSRLDKEFSPPLCSYLTSISTPMLVENLVRKGDQQWKNSLKELGVQVLIPLQLQNQTKGMLALGEKLRGEQYSPMDLEFLFSLGNLAIISLENARLFKEAIEKQKLEDELLIAKEIQRGLLPAHLPMIQNFEIAAINISSKQVGGDYYDVIPLPEDRFVIAIGDVSGKGTPASLLMANLQATIRALVPLGLSLSELTNRVNDLVCNSTGSGRFITFFWGILDSRSRKMKYVSAGHNPPFLFHTDGTVERLDRGGIILGIMKVMVSYQEGEVQFGAGDLLVLFTDGVSEAMNDQGEEWGEEPLERVVRDHLDDASHVVLTHIVDAVKDHSKNTVQSDDITLVIVKAVA